MHISDAESLLVDDLAEEEDKLQLRNVSVICSTVHRSRPSVCLSLQLRIEAPPENDNKNKYCALASTQFLGSEGEEEARLITSHFLHPLERSATGSYA